MSTRIKAARFMARAGGLLAHEPLGEEGAQGEHVENYGDQGVDVELSSESSEFHRGSGRHYYH